MNSEYDPIKRRQYYLNRKELELAKNKEYREANKEHLKQINKVWYYKDKQNTVKYMLKYAKARAKKKGLEFTITEEHIIIPEVCPVFKVPLIPGDPKFCPSIDRINPKGGYTPDNIQILSKLANILKWDASADELKAFCTGYLRLLEGGTGLC